ncbi:P-loop containing nucleoside triphosphate hydrolase protein [Nemania serpens]|nr:P-loop containing nucleoside triphosphate hydrolase protein [Nemania serpens]
MCPAVVPEARIFTYDWNANYFENAPVQTLLSHAENLLAHVVGEQGSISRPIIFIASCFGGLVLAEAINRAAQEGSSYRHVLLNTAGIVFLATPFRGSDGAKQAQWQVVVGGIMGNETSTQLVEGLNSNDKELRKLTQTLAELIHRDTVRLPVCCFYETEKTEMLKRLLSADLASRKILVTEQSACLDGVKRQSLNATHSGTNKFDGPDDANYILVKNVIRGLADDAPTVIRRRKNIARRRHFMVPFGRNRDFVGRGSILEQLLETIPPGADQDDCRRAAVEGLGGIGKTQVALEAAYQVRDAHPDCSIFWVPAVDLTSFENAYREIGKLLNIPGIDDDKADVKLLIIDNADDIDMLFQDAKLANYLPFSRQGSILFTTRNHHVAVRLDIPQKNIITVQEMENAKATNLLRIGLKESQIGDAESIKHLLRFLANLPLAIKQASAYMAFNINVTVSQYLEFCESSNTDLIYLLSHARTQNPVATTWLISFEHISQHNPRAADYLKFICFLAEKDIPQSLLPPILKMQTAEAIGSLSAYAFILERDKPGSFDVHRLVRLVMRSWLQEKGEWGKWTVNVVQRLTEEYPFPQHENREIWTKYLAHAQAVLEVDSAIHTDKDGSLLFNIAESYSILGKYNNAEQLYWQTLQLREEVLGREHPDTLASMNNLALVLNSQGKYDEAEAMHRQTLQLREEVLGREHPSTLTSMNNLANVLDRQGKYGEAETMHRQELELCEEVLGREHPSTLGSMNNLALVLDSQGKYGEAETMHRQTLQLREEVLGREHPDTLASMNNLALVLQRQGKYDEAEKILTSHRISGFEYRCLRPVTI